MPRGWRGAKKRKLKLFSNKRASRGTKGAYGGKRAFPTWKDVKTQIKKNATTIIVPPKDETAEKKADAGKH